MGIMFHVLFCFIFMPVYSGTTDIMKNKSKFYSEVESSPPALAKVKTLFNYPKKPVYEPHRSVEQIWLE